MGKCDSKCNQYEKNKKYIHFPDRTRLVNFLRNYIFLIFLVSKILKRNENATLIPKIKK